MSKYVTLVKLTPQGMASMGDPKRAYDEMIKASGQLGIKVIGGYATLGPYDLMILYEASDEITAAGMAMVLGTRLGGQAETWTLIPSEEFTKLIIKK